MRISAEQWIEIQGFLGRVGDPLGFAQGKHLREDLSLYLSLLLQKNTEVNLTAIRDPEAAVWKHIADSLALAQWEPLGAVLDWGSGGGMPGIPLALARRGVGDTKSVDFLDSVGKKIKAVEGFARDLGLEGCRFFLGRGEDLCKQGVLTGVDTVLMRAVAPAERAVHWLHPSLPRWVLLLGPQQRELWLAEERRLQAKGFRFGREASFELPQNHGQRVLLELVQK